MIDVLELIKTLPYLLKNSGKQSMASKLETIINMNIYWSFEPINCSNILKKEGMKNMTDNKEENERSPNDQRSDVLNENNPEYQAALDNKANQLNPQHPAYHASRGKK